MRSTPSGLSATAPGSWGTRSRPRPIRPRDDCCAPRRRGQRWLGARCLPRPKGIRSLAREGTLRSLRIGSNDRLLARARRRASGPAGWAGRMAQRRRSGVRGDPSNVRLREASVKAKTQHVVVRFGVRPQHPVVRRRGSVPGSSTGSGRSSTSYAVSIHRRWASCQRLRRAGRPPGVHIPRASNMRAVWLLRPWGLRRGAAGTGSRP